MTSDTIGPRPAVPHIVPILNPLIRRLLGIGMPMGPNALVTVRGRTSGEPRTFPAAVMHAGGRQYLIATFGEVNWVQNLRVAGTASIRRGRMEETFRAHELGRDLAEQALREALGPLLRSRLAAPMLRRWYGLSTKSTASDYRRAASVHPVFELEPLDSPVESAVGPSH